VTDYDALRECSAFGVTVVYGLCEADKIFLGIVLGGKLADLGDITKGGKLTEHLTGQGRQGEEKE
jgi:hypothetical protein